MSIIHAMNLQSIDLNLLVVFEALMEERNVTRAARRVGLSQPAMSNALARLRRTFDDPLLVRAGKGMVPTPAAQSLDAAVRASLAHLRRVIEAKPAFDPSASERTFHILSNDYAELTLLAPLMRAVRGLSSNIVIRAHRSQSIFQSPSANSLSESYDLALGFFPDALSLEPGLRSELLWEEKNVCIASAKHEAIRGRMTARQYASAGHVAVFYKPEGPGVIDTLLAEKGLARRVKTFVPHFSTVPNLVATSDLIATVPERLARHFSRQLKLQVLAVPISMPPFRFTMLWHERFGSDPANEWLRGMVRAAAKL